MELNEEKFIRDATQCIYNSLEIDKSLYTLFNYLKQYLPLNLLCTPIFDLESKSLRYLALASEKGGIFIVVSLKLSQESRDYLWEIRNQVSIFSQADKIPFLQELRSFFLKNPYFDLSDNFSTLAIALETESPLYGGLGLIASGENRYKEHHKYLVKLLTKPLSKAIANLLRFREIIRHNENLTQEKTDPKNRFNTLPDSHVIGAEKGLKGVMDMVVQVAPLNSPVLIIGETGVGKEVIVHAIHDFSKRSKKPLISVNCGAIPDTLIDSELFGHVKGAFTGATHHKIGYFEQADGGTIFLDEIGELSLQAQVKLLRVLQHMEFQSVGGNNPISVDVRVIAATHRDLPLMVKQKKFRHDLWYRLNVFPINIPPLRERKEDIPLLSEYFAVQKAKEMNFQSIPQFTPDAFKHLKGYDWPGNARELQNVIERAIIISNNKPLSFQHLFFDSIKNEDSTTTDQNDVESFKTLDEILEKHLRDSLTLSKGRIEGPSGAAKLLGINPSTLRSKMRKLGISFGRGQSY